MAAMMPSSSTSGGTYDNDAVERDLIDPDDGRELPVLAQLPPVC
jgi:hypothetical protein